MTSEKLESLPKVTRHTHSERSHGARDKKREKLYMRMEGDFFCVYIIDEKGNMTLVQKIPRLQAAEMGISEDDSAFDIVQKSVAAGL